MSDQLGTGFCYTDHQLINICNENPHFVNDDRIFRTFFGAPEMNNTQDDKLLLAHVTKGKAVAAPFTGKCSPGKVMAMRHDARELKSFDFANIHIRNTIEPCRADDPALRVRDDGSFEDSEDARWRMAQETMAMYFRESVEITEYKMMVDMILYGMTDVHGDDFPSHTIDLCRPEDHTIDLTEQGDGFCDPCFDVFAELANYTERMRRFGASGPKDVVMDKVAAKALTAHPQFRKWYDKCCFNYQPPEQGRAANFGPVEFETSELLAASRDGRWRFWVTCGTICESVTDPETGIVTDQDVPVMPTGSLVVIDRRALRARRMFAPIRKLYRRGGGNYSGIRRIASPYWLDTKIDEDCDAVTMHMWSRPLPIVGCTGATVFAKVATEECTDALCECPPLGVEPVEDAKA